VLGNILKFLDGKCLDFQVTFS